MSGVCRVQKTEEGMRSLEIGVKIVATMGVLETEHKSSEKAASALTQLSLWALLVLPFLKNRVFLCSLD